MMPIVSTFPPRQCGIATFASHLRQGMRAAGVPALPVIALVKDRDQRGRGGSPIASVIHQDTAGDYAAAARFVNTLNPRAVFLQHEFGIFGGEDGRYVLEFIHGLKVPVIATLHTVPERPTPGQRYVLRELGRACERVVVLARRAQTMLSSTYDIDEDSIIFIPHGVPAPPPGTSREWKRRLGLEHRIVVMTFGLIGPGKGIEVAIDAVAQVAADHPDLVYLIVGATHPEVKRRHGEAYREFLMERAARQGLGGQIRFVNRYLTDRQLLGYLRACDIYITPYPNRDQISSGTLTYAAFTGKAIISTPYIYAEELLGDGGALFFPFGDVNALTEALRRLVEDPVERHRTAAAARQRTREYAWSTVGREYVNLIADAAPAFAAKVEHPAWI